MNNSKLVGRSADIPSLSFYLHTLFILYFIQKCYLDPYNNLNGVAPFTSFFCKINNLLFLVDTFIYFLSIFNFIYSLHHFLSYFVYIFQHLNSTTLMFILSFLLLFTTLTLLLFKLVFNSLISIIILEIISFLVLLVLRFVGASFIKSILLLLIFSLFILESVLGLVFLINLVSFSGVDYTNISLFS